MQTSKFLEPKEPVQIPDKQYKRDPGSWSHHNSHHASQKMCSGVSLTTLPFETLMTAFNCITLCVKMYYIAHTARNINRNYFNLMSHYIANYIIYLVSSHTHDSFTKGFHGGVTSYRKYVYSMDVQMRHLVTAQNPTTEDSVSTGIIQ